MLDCSHTCSFIVGDEIPKGWVFIENLDLYLKYYNTLEIYAFKDSNDGLSDQIKFSNLIKFTWKTSEDIFGLLNNTSTCL